MGRFHSLLALPLLVGLAATGTSPGQPDPLRDPQLGPSVGHPDAIATGGFVPDQIIVRLQENLGTRLRDRVDAEARLWGARTGSASLDALALRFGVREMRSMLHPALRAMPGAGGSSPLRDFYLVTLGRGQDARQAVAQYRKDPGVSAAQLNYLYTPDLVPHDPLYPQQWSHQVAAAESGWDITTGEGAVRITIAVIGQGMQLDHPDLARNLVPGYDFYDGDTDPAPGPFEGHETSVAGVTAAVTNNAEGVAGVCWGCRIMPLRIDYTTEQVAQAIAFAVAGGARVVNMSFGNYSINKYGPDSVVEAAIDGGYAQGVVMVATAGNDASDTRRYPGALDHVLGVAATDRFEQRARFSNFGLWVAVAAPGDRVYSATLDGAYGEVSGTSFAAPYVAGLAGLILSKNPALSVDTVRLMIEYTADRIPTDRFIGSGRVNLQRALELNGAPAVYAVIKAPDRGKLVGSAPLEFWGTALGESYVLEYRPAGAPGWTEFGAGAQTIDATLGVLDPAGIDEGFFDVRLTASSGGSVDQHLITLERSGSSPPQPGWPQTGSFVLFSSPILADLDGDALEEVIVGQFGFGDVTVYRGNGTPQPGWPPPSGGVFRSTTPSVGDLDGDGAAEIVVASQSNASVAAWHADGTVVPGFPRSAGPSGGQAFIWSGVTLADLDADGALEIITLASDGLMHVWKADGTDLSGWPKTLRPNIQTSAAVGDLDGDGLPEIVVRQWDTLYVFTPDGSDRPGWPLSTFPSGNISPVLSDLDGDGLLEIIDGEYRGAVAVYDTAGHLEFRTLTPNTMLQSTLSVGDLDADGIPEIFFGDDAGLVHGLDAAGHALPGWPVAAGGDINGAPLVVDLDGDRRREVVIASTDGALRAWHDDGSPALSYVVGSVIDGSPAVGDLDGDGDPELIAAAESGVVVALDLPGVFDRSGADWPMFRNDPRHTGVYRPVGRPLRAPENLRGDVSATLPNTVELTWDQPPGSGAPTGYDLYRNGSLLARIGPERWYADTTALIGTANEYYLVGFDTTGQLSPPSDTISVTPVDESPPTPPADLMVDPGEPVDGAVPMLLHWTASTDDLGLIRTGVVAYHVYRKGDRIGTQDAATTSYLDVVYEPDTEYEYEVRAVDAAGNVSDHSNRVKVRTPKYPTDHQRPTPPADLTVELGGPVDGWFSALLQWTASTDDAGIVNTGVAEYRVYRGKHLIATLDATMTSYRDPALKPDKRYEYYVRAVDGAGNVSDKSERVKVRTPKIHR